jgi:ATP-dependent DNA helicase RecG
MILIGVADDGTTPGLNTTAVSRINQLISNAASQLVRSPLAVQTENVPVAKGRVVIVLTVPKGIDKPYFDKNGVIWLKTGADKRRVNSKEELRRLFQFTNQFHADELPTQAGIDKLDKLRFRDFLRDVHKRDFPDAEEERLRLLKNMNLATNDGFLNLAGVLLFAERPEWIKPQFVVKTIRYPGNTIHVSEYLDTEDFEGPLQKIFDGALAFIMRNLRKVQAGRGVNAPGQAEIPESVFEELLVNALVHRDYLVNAPIRIFILRQSHRNHQPRPPAQQSDRGENPRRELQHPQSDSGLLRRQRPVALSRPRIGHQARLGTMAANRVYRRP